MDFSYLLELAKKNEEQNKNDKSIKFSTKVPTAKKVSKPGPKVKAINDLLSKIEDEKKKKDKEFSKQRDELLALRAESKHSKKRVRSLINRTKGASKAVLDDAKDLTTAKGEAQCDEDDYGYESALSQQIFSKLQTTYSELPEDERLKFKKTEKSSIEDIKNRVMSSLKKKEDEELGIRKRKRNRKSKTGEEDDGFINDGDEYRKFDPHKDGGEPITEKEKDGSHSSKKRKKSSRYDIDPSLLPPKADKYSNFKYEKEKKREEKIERKEKEKEKEKKKSSSKSAPPPMSFEELMKMAQKKQKEPLPIIDPLQELLKKKEKEREKCDDSRPLTAKEKRELEEDKLRRLKKMGKTPPGKEVLKSKDALKSKDLKDIKSANDKSSKEEKVSKENDSLSEQPKKVIDRSKFFALPKATPQNASKTNLNVSKSSEKSDTKIKVEKEPPVKQKPQLPSKNKPIKVETAPVRSFSKPPKVNTPPVRSFPPPSFPTKSKRPPQQKPIKRRIDSDEEDEYDSEMDDFIDDDNDEGNYRDEIAKMFGYDKNKYRDEDDDCADMEASFGQVEAEEIYSLQVGIKEDEEDMKKEEAEKKRKKMMKMMMKKRKL